jgi:NADPH-dependent 2,4-dienoyl-CoA reductase/sulfur reductase-like enzyme
MAGLHTARLLRENGFAGEVTLLGAEPHAPYDRPPLSKQVLHGTMEAVADLAFPFDFAAADVVFRPGERAVAWTPGFVTTDKGAALPYDALVVATGSEPVRLPFIDQPTSELTQTLRTYEDAVRLRSGFAAGRRLAIVGAGWIGAEVATAAREAGCEVDVLEAQVWPLQALFPEEIGRAMADWYKDAGVQLWLSSPVTQIDRNDHDFSEQEDFGEPKKWSEVSVTVSWGEYAEVSSVLVAVGARPDNRWLGPTFDYAPDGALLVDSQLRTSVGNVFAVGDCAAYYSERYGRHLRVEHWDNALRGPATVADNVLGGSAEHDPVPYFWSEQFGRMVQYAGRHADADRMVVRGDLSAPTWSVCWLDTAGRLSAVLAVGRPRDLAQGRRLIEAGTALDAARVADPATALTAAAA